MSEIGVRKFVVPLLWVAVLGLVTWAYQPGLSGPLLLDDEYNLAPLDSLSDGEGYLLDVVFGNHSGELGRPVSMASFAVEKRYFDHGLPGQKIVGLLIHLLNGTLILLLSRALLRAANQPRASEAALVIAALWLSMPLLLSTTLYVIQRMTSLSATFSLLALLFYCQARAALNSDRLSWAWLAACLLSVALAAFAKENGILVVPMIVALEVFIFGFRTARPRAGRVLRQGHLSIVVLGCLGAAAVAIVFPEKFFDYSDRDYGLMERLLTQARVLSDYVVQMAWPDVNRLGVYHDDFPWSSSLFDPAGTWLAVLAWMSVAAAVAACGWLGRFRLAAFGLALFLIGHLMESTVIALELYFEHRNYLPAFGLLFAAVAAGNQLRERWPVFKGWLELLAAVVLFNNLVSLGSQAVVWSDNLLLHINAVNYHPRSDRALLALADIHANGGQAEAALALLEESNELTDREPAMAAMLEAFYSCTAGHTLDAAVFEVDVPGRDEMFDVYFAQAAESLVTLVTLHHCGRDSAVLVADVLRQWVLPGNEALGPVPVVSSLLLLENELQRYDVAMLYAEQLVGAEPDHVMGLQFMLVLSFSLDAADKREFARSRLLELRDEGKLTREEVANLELFL